MARRWADRLGLWGMIAIATLAVALVAVFDPVRRAGELWARLSAHDPKNTKVIVAPPRVGPRGPMKMLMEKGVVGPEAVNEDP